MQYSLPYSILLRLVQIGLKIYLGRVEVYGNEDLPAPALYTPNHQNALIDTLVITAAVNDRQLSFIARSDIFKKGWIERFMRSVKMIPIFRPRDKVDIITQNKATFAEVIKRLHAGDTIKIFPEGNHGAARRIRPLKKGFARMAFKAEEATDFGSGICVVPIGIYFEAPQEVGTDTLIFFGKAIEVKAYKTEYKNHPAKGIKRLKEDLEKQLQSLTIHIESEAHYEVIESLRKILRSTIQKEQPKEKKPLFRNFKSDQFIIAKSERIIAEDEAYFNTIAEETLAYNEDLARLKLNYKVMEKQASNTRFMLYILAGILLLPIVLFGLINCILPYSLLKKYVLPKAKDPIFYSTFAFTVSLFLFPIVWLLQSFVLAYFTTWKIATLYFLLLPILLKVIIFLHKKSKDIKAEYHYTKWRKTPQMKLLQKRRTNIILRFVNY